MMGGFGMLGWGMWAMILFWVVVIALAIWIVAWVVRGTQARSAPGSSTIMPNVNQAPLDILKTRYARGEITKEQFEELKSHLSG